MVKELGCRNGGKGNAALLNSSEGSKLQEWKDEQGECRNGKGKGEEYRDGEVKGPCSN